MEEAVELRKQLKAAAGERPAPVVQRPHRQGRRARADASSRAPTAPTATGSFELYSRVNVGVAVAGQDALVVPTVFDADRKSLGEIAARVARAGREGARRQDHPARALRPARSPSPTSACTGSTASSPVINPPQAAILGVGAMSPQPVGRRRRGDRARADDAHARLRPPDPLRRRRRGVPRAASASGSRTRSASPSDTSSPELFGLRPNNSGFQRGDVGRVGAVERRVGRRGASRRARAGAAARARARRPGRCRRRRRRAAASRPAGSAAGGRSGLSGCASGTSR